METREERTPREEIERLIETGAEVSRVREFVASLPEGEAAFALSRMDEDLRTRVIALLDPRAAASLVGQIPDAQTVGIMEHLEPGAAAAILTELRSDEKADILGDLDQPEAEAILAELPPEEARDARILSHYADDVAGGLMLREYLAYPESRTAGEVVDDLRAHAERYRDYQVQYAFVTRSDGSLVGVLRLRELLFAPRDRRIDQLMIEAPLSVPDTEPLDALRAFFDRHPFFGVPVTDPSGKLLGVVRRSAVSRARAERSEGDYLKSQGIVGGEELRTMPLLVRARRRLAWLSVNIGLNVIAASVIAFYQQTLAAVIALAVFLPIISDMSGCSGNQAVAVSMRELTLGLIRPTEILRVWWKEITVGLLNGVVLGALIAGVAWLWKGNAYLGLVVGLAMAGNTLVAVSIGGIVPLALRRMKLDPALASGPILTTVTDMCGFFLILSLASSFLPRLAGP